MNGKPQSSHARTPRELPVSLGSLFDHGAQIRGAPGAGVLTAQGLRNLAGGFQEQVVGANSPGAIPVSGVLIKTEPDSVGWPLPPMDQGAAQKADPGKFTALQRVFVEDGLCRGGGFLRVRRWELP